MKHICVQQNGGSEEQSLLKNAQMGDAFVVPRAIYMSTMLHMKTLAMREIQT